MSQITSKKVTRWYLDGKGYASRKIAYKKLAYQYLLDELLGEVDNGSRTKLKGLTDDEVKTVMHDVFADKFPHEVSPRCHYVCRMNYKEVWDAYNGPDTEEDGFAFDSCKAAQQDWINNKAEELYETTRTRE